MLSFLPQPLQLPQQSQGPLNTGQIKAEGIAQELNAPNGIDGVIIKVESSKGWLEKGLYHSHSAVDQQGTTRDAGQVSGRIQRINAARLWLKRLQGQIR